MKKTSLLLLLTIVTAGIMGQDSEALRPGKSKIVPVIDGILNDEAWKEAPKVSGFKTFSPDFGLDMSQLTTVYMLYDEENIYFAFDCKDDEPDKIKASVNSRNNIRADDWICVNLDSFNDHQSLYAFYVNPHGIQMDSRFSAGQEDSSVDFVWYSAGTISDDGYRIEMQIPLKSIRFTTREPVEMSVLFERMISRQRVQGSYPAMDPSKGMAFLTQMKPMIYEGVRHYKLFELLPAFTYTARNRHIDGEMRSDERTPTLSLTAKYGITSQLILDGTVNPDFSQVESDAGQVDVNLRYDLFFPEKRPFFLEGHDNFIIAATRADEHDPVNTLIHTRKIANPVTGIKLTGKASERLTMAALYSLDRVDNPDGSSNDKMSHYPILRMKYSLSEDSYIGGIYTGMEMDSTFNRVAGLDGQIRVGGGSSIMYNAIYSNSLSDPLGESYNGYMVSGEFAHDSRNITYSFGGKSISKDFNVETGYIRRRGINYFKGLVKPKFYPKADFVQRVDLELFSKQTQDIEYNMWETVDHLAAWIFFKGSTYIKVKAEYSNEIFLGERFNTGGFHGLVSSQLGKRLNAAVLYQRLGSPRYVASPYQGNTNRFLFMANYKPSNKIHIDLTYTYSDFYNSSTGEQDYNYSIVRGKLTYQMNKYFFLRAITEYNGYYETMLTDFLASFTYIPGTVVYLGYGSAYERTMWDGNSYVYDKNLNFMETTRGFFFKASYLHRF
jgi:hypothetical protein